MRAVSYFIVSLFIGFSTLVADTSAGAKTEKPIALVGGMLLDGYEAEPIHDAVVVMKGNEIIIAGPRHKTPIPDNAHIIDTRGKTIMPGLIDMHMHLDLIGHGDYDRYYKFLRGTERLHEVLPIAAKQMLRGGVTTGVDLGTPFDILETRQEIRSGAIPGPRLVISGPWITRIKLDGVPDSYQVVISSPEEARKKAKELIDKGSDVIKTWLGLTLDDLKAIVKEAHKNGVKVHSHLYKPEAIRNAIEAGVDVFQHVGSARNPAYDNALVSEIAHKRIPVVQTISHRIWVYPATVAFPARLSDPALQKDMPDDIYTEVQDSFKNYHRLPYFHDIGDETRNSKQSAKQFIEAGAYMGVGTDAASPLNFHTEAMWREMSALVDSGMTNIQVISAATKTGAELIGKFDERGTIEPGKLADIIVIDGDPLSNIDAMKHVILTIKDGVPWYPESNPLPILRDIGRPYN
jgi:imidazolonepropionase-like amidohydrolase